MMLGAVQVQLVADDDSPVLLQTAAAEAHCPWEDAQTRTTVPSPVFPPPKIGVVSFVTPPDGCVSVGVVSTVNIIGADAGPSVSSAWRTVAVTLYVPSSGTFTEGLHCHVWPAFVDAVQVSMNVPLLIVAVT